VSADVFYSVSEAEFNSAELRADDALLIRSVPAGATSANLRDVSKAIAGSAWLAGQHKQYGNFWDMLEAV